jgi:hypothetical protein
VLLEGCLELCAHKAVSLSAGAACKANDKRNASKVLPAPSLTDSRQQHTSSTLLQHPTKEGGQLWLMATQATCHMPHATTRSRCHN